MAQTRQEKNDTGNQEVVSDQWSQQKPQSKARAVSDGICDPVGWGSEDEKILSGLLHAGMSQSDQCR